MRMQSGRREVPAFVALATVWLMVQGVVGAATSGNTLRASHLTLDQYSPLPLYHHGLGLELYGRRSNDGNSQPEDEHQVNRKVEDDSVAYRSTNDRHRRRDSSIASISINDFPIVERTYDVNVVGSNPREQSPRIVPSETIVRTGWRSKNFAGSKEFGKEGVDYAAAPPSETDEPFVADETFQDEGPGSVEIYKLDLFEKKKVPMTVRTLTVVPVTTRTTNNNNNNKSKVPKKSSRLSWKLGKSTRGVIKSTTSDGTRPTTRIMMITDGKDDGKDSKNLLHGRSSFWESELRSEAPPNGDAFGVGGVPELQVGCEGLEASSSSYYSRKLRRSIVETKNETHQDDPATELDIVPISLNLDYDWSDGSDEEMDELLKLKKFQSEVSKRKENRGDIDPMLDDFFNQESDVKEKLPIRGDLGNATGESIKRLDESGSKRGRRSVDESVKSESDSSGYGSRLRKLLWTEDSEENSNLWGYGENEGILPDDDSNGDESRRHREGKEHGNRAVGRGRNEHGRNVANAEIDMIREEYEKLLEKQRREEEERLRRLKELEARRSSTSNDRRDEEERRRSYEEERRRSYEERMRMEELRRREEARRREKEEEELRRGNPDDSRRNLTPEDRRSYEERRREWMMKRRQEEEREHRRRLEEERKRRMEKEEEERRRQEEERNAPSNLVRAGYPYDRRNESRIQEEERMRLERERKLWEDRERERQMNRQRYGDDDSERRRMEDERRRYRLGQERSPNNVTREEENRKRMEEERRKMIERRREEARRREERRREEERHREEERRREEERHREEERRRIEQDPSRNPNVTRDRTNEEYQRRLEEHRRKMEEDQRRLEEERKLQEYIRRNQPIDLRSGQSRNEWNASRRREEEEEQQRRAIEAVRQLNRSRYPGLSSERRQHGPSAPTYIDPRVSLDESRRRQEMEASLQRQRQEEEQRRRQEEERRREEEYRRQQSRRYEEERKRMEERRREEERRRQYAIEEQRRRQYAIEEQRRRLAATASSTRGRQDSWPRTRQDFQDRASQRGRQDTASPVPANLLLEGRRRDMERERIRQEEERRRQQARDNERRRHEARLKAQREREAYMRSMEEQRKRQEARLNALPVSARIIIRDEGSPTHSRPSFSSRAGFGNEIDFPRMNPYNKGLTASRFPSPPTKQTLVESPSPCVWAVVQCCPTNTNRLVTCFESLGCPGVNWDPDPCRETIADAARDQVMRFYAASEEENRY